MTSAANAGVHRGVLTLASGDDKYFRFARSLALSLRYHVPSLPLCLTTDKPHHEVSSLFDVISEIGGEPGFAQKVELDQHSPFEETLFLDSDSLAVRDVTPVFDLLLAEHDFAVPGRHSANGYWFMDTAAMCKRLGVDSIPQFNGGLYAWRRGEKADQLFARARELLASYDDLPVERVRDAPADEIVFSLAMAIEGIPAVDDGGKTMRTPIGLQGELSVDVLGGTAAFVKSGYYMEPAIVHFPGWTDSPVYLREVAKLKLASRAPFIPPGLISRAYDGAWRLRALKRRLASLSRRTSGS